MTTEVLFLNGSSDNGVLPWKMQGSGEIVGHVLHAISPETTDLYIGEEAFTNFAELPSLVKHCDSRSIGVHLFTRGEQFDKFGDAVEALATLRQCGNFTVLWVCDKKHWEAANREHLSVWLKALRHVGLCIELLYLQHEKEAPPTELLLFDEINTLGMIYCRDAKNLRAFVEQKGWRVLSAQAPRPATKCVERAGSTHAARAQVAGFPLMFNTLVIETTHFCNARCSHCYTSCGPDASAERMPLDKIKRVIAEAAALPNLSKRCHVGGGEATIFWKEMLEILSTAKQHGFTNSIVTNGWWGKSEAIAAKKIIELKHAGVDTIELSIDAMHQEFIASKPVGHVVAAAKKCDVRVTLRVCTTKSRRAGAVLDQLLGQDLSGVTVAVSRATPTGRGKTDIAPDDIFSEDRVPLGACHNFLNLTVVPNGDLFPCCAGSEICPSLKLGNAFETPLGEIMATLPGNVFVRTLVHAGPAYFLMLLEEAGMTDWRSRSFSGICHLCNEICSEAELVTAVKRKLADKLARTIPEVVASI